MYIGERSDRELSCYVVKTERMSRVMGLFWRVYCG